MSIDETNRGDACSQTFAQMTVAEIQVLTETWDEATVEWGQLERDE